MTRSPLQLARDFFALSGGEVLAKVAAFAAFAWLARVLPAESYGAVELASAVTMVLTLVVDFGFGPIGARELAHDRSRAPLLAAGIPTLRLGLALLCLAGLFVATSLFHLEPHARHLVRIYGFSLLGLPWVLNWLFQGLGRMGWVAGAQLVRNGTFAALVVLLVKGTADLASVGFIEVAAAGVMALYYLSVQLGVVGAPRLGGAWRELRRLFLEALPVGASRSSWALAQYASTLLVAGIVGGAQVAWFGAAHRLATSLGTFVNLYHFNLYPQLVEAVAAGPERVARFLRPSLRVSAWLGVGGALTGTLLAEPLCQLVFGARFDVAGPVFALLIWTVPVSLLGAHPRFVLIGAGHQRAELVSNATGAATTLGLGVLLVPVLGVRGGALAMLAGALATWAVAQALARTRVGALPALRPALRPLGLAALLLLAARGLAPTGGWLPGLVALAVYAAAAPFVDHELRRDARAVRGGGIS